MSCPAPAPRCPLQEFSAQYPNLFYTAADSNGVVHDLVPGGASVRVTFSNRHDYCRKVVKVCARACRRRILA